MRAPQLRLSLAILDLLEPLSCLGRLRLSPRRASSTNTGTAKSGRRSLSTLRTTRFTCSWMLIQVTGVSQ